MDVSLLRQTECPGALSNSRDPFLRTIWHKTAPGTVRKAFRSGKPSKGRLAWAKHLAERGRPLPLSELLPGKTSPLAWCLPDEVQGGRFLGLLAEIEQLCSGGPAEPSGTEQDLLAWLADAAGSAPTTGYAMEALAWCHALPRLAGRLSGEVWWDLLEHLRGAAAEAKGIALDRDPLAHQLLAGELPLTLAYLFGEIVPCRKLGRQARKELSTGVVELLDGEGLPHAEKLPLLRPLLACWTRCRAMGSELAKGCWNEAAQTQYEWLVRQALRLVRPDGTCVFSGPSSGAWCEALFNAAIRFGGDRDDRRIAARVLPGVNQSDNGRVRKGTLPEAGVHSEWAAVGLLRSGWDHGDPCLGILYSDRSAEVEFQCREEMLWAGRWELEIRRDGRLLCPEGPWEEACWVSDDDVDYLELEMAFEGGLNVQRHVVLAKQDDLLLLADAILDRRPACLEYRAVLPLAEGISFQPAAETREGYLKGRRRLALALPLALPEWRADPRAGSLTETEWGLELRQQAQAQSMFAPLCFDLRPRRVTRPFTWRQLTIAENLQVQPDDVAVGYRVRIGKEQWLIYRALSSKGSRTLLGHNLTSEFLLARFDGHGEVKSLVEIE